MQLNVLNLFDKGKDVCQNATYSKGALLYAMLSERPQACDSAREKFCLRDL